MPCVLRKPGCHNASPGTLNEQRTILFNVKFVYVDLQFLSFNSCCNVPSIDEKNIISDLAVHVKYF